MSECVCCGSTAGKLWGAKHVNGANWSLDRCPRCGYCYVWPRPSWQVVDAFYREHGGHGRSSARQLSPSEILSREEAAPNSMIDAKSIVDGLARRLSDAAQGARGRSAPSLLDVGCGYGFFSRQARARGFEVTAIEMSDHEATVAREIAGVDPLRIAFEEFDCSKTFDAILMSQVLEHALDPDLWIQRSHRLLRPGGALAIAVPNFGGIFRLLLGIRDFMIIPPAHLNYFDPRSLASLLRRRGFGNIRVVHVTRIPPDTLRRRLGPSKLLGAPAVAVGKVLCRGVDAAGIGAIINVYATRE